MFCFHLLPPAYQPYDFPVSWQRSCKTLPNRIFFWSFRIILAEGTDKFLTDSGALAAPFGSVSCSKATAASAKRTTAKLVFIRSHYTRWHKASSYICCFIPDLSPETVQECAPNAMRFSPPPGRITTSPPPKNRACVKVSCYTTQAPRTTCQSYSNTLPAVLPERHPPAATHGLLTSRGARAGLACCHLLPSQ